MQSAFVVERASRSMAARTALKVSTGHARQDLPGLHEMVMPRPILKTSMPMMMTRPEDGTFAADAPELTDATAPIFLRRKCVG